MSHIDLPPPATEKQESPRETALATDGPFAANMMLGQMASEITQEVMDFAGRRMRAQLDFVSTLPVGDVKGMMEAQFRFFEQASRDYTQEFNQVTEVVRKAASPRA